MMELCDKSNFTRMNAAIKMEALKRYPDLNENHILLLSAVYTCHIMLNVVFKYTSIQSSKIKEVCQLPAIGDILPLELYALDKLIIQYAGDKPIELEDFDAFVNIFVNKLMSVEFNDIDQNQSL